VLAAGGISTGGTVSSSEIFDPATGVWTSTGSMTTARFYNTMALLPNGTVLAAGGEGSGGYLSSAEIFDPATGVWTSTGSMTAARVQHTMTLLPNGTVLVAGGSNSGGIVSSAEVFTPYYSFSGTVTGNGSPIPGAVVSATGTGTVTTTTASDGTYTLSPLVSGGSYTVSASTAGYTVLPANITVSNMSANMTAQNFAATSTNVLTVQITPAAGVNNATLSNVSVTGVNFRSGATVQLTRTGQTAITATGVSVVTSSQIVCALPLSGAATGQWNVLVTNTDTSNSAITGGFTVAFSSNTRVWSGTAALSVARYAHTATTLYNGKVLVAGGTVDSNSSLSSAELYNPATNAWTTSAMPHSHFYHTATTLTDGTVLVAGGVSSSLNAYAEIYNPATGVWTSTGSLNAIRAVHTATLLPDGRVLVAGGYNISGVIASAEIYNPQTGIWTYTGSLNAARYHHTATLLTGGKVLVAGGMPPGGGALSSCEIFDENTGVWTSTGPLSAGRSYQTATLLSDGRVLAAGGYDATGGTALASAEIFNPATGLWTATGSMTHVRAGHAAFLLPDGRVLVSGGYDGTAVLGTSEIYDPSSGTWTASSSFGAGQYIPSLTMLPDGRLLLAAGEDVNNNPLASAQINAPAARVSGTATLNSSGIAGTLLSVTGSSTTAVSAAGNGTYSFTLPLGSNYTVTPSSAGYSFLPVSVATATLLGDWAAQNFTGTLNNFTVSGQVTVNGSPLPGAIVTVSGSSSTYTTTNSLGDYSFSLPATGSYTLTISSANYTFQTVSVSSSNLSGNWTGNNFSGTASGFAVTGTVTSGGKGVAGVTLTASGTAAASATTDASGNYSFTLANGAYMIKPALSGYVMSPTDISVAVAGAAVPGEDFVAMKTDGRDIIVQGGPNGYAEPQKGYNANIMFTSPAQSGHVTVKIYTSRNAILVRTLETDVNAGIPAQLVWDCRNRNGEAAGSGVYIALVNGAGYTNEKVQIGVLK